jgi:hypothetical protein
MDTCPTAQTTRPRGGRGDCDEGPLRWMEHGSCFCYNPVLMTFLSSHYFRFSLPSTPSFFSFALLRYGAFIGGKNYVLQADPGRQTRLSTRYRHIEERDNPRGKPAAGGELGRQNFVCSFSAIYVLWSFWERRRIYHGRLYLASIAQVFSLRI